MVNPEDNSVSDASGTRPAFGYTLKLLISFMFIFISCLNINTRTCYVSLTFVILLKYLLNCGIKLYQNSAYHLTIQYIDDRMISVSSFANSIKLKAFDGSNFKRW